MKKKVDSVLKNVLDRIDIPAEEFSKIKNFLDDFIKKLEKNRESLKINAEIFVGGSFAKRTMIKKDHYDVDIFMRFDKRYREEEFSKLAFKIIKGIKNVEVVHGSRDYFRIKTSKGLFFEVVPVKRIKNPKEAKNITDLSYSHVKYIKSKLKSEKILNEVKLVKAFCYANKCYGAESYVRGFSGYSLELLIYHYGSFFKFVNEMSKIKNKEIIDIEKLHKKKNLILVDLNASKLQSPVILIDPTYKQRNVLAALSEETFGKFQKICRNFLKNPNSRAFEVKKTDFEKIKENAKKKKYEFILFEAKTDRQKGDIAGSKLLKFHNHLTSEVKRYFEVKDSGFEYQGSKSAKYFFVVKNKKEIVFNGPGIDDEKNVKRFRKKHKSVFIKNGKFYSKMQVKTSLKQFLMNWKRQNQKRMKEMSVVGLEIIS